MIEILESVWFSPGDGMNLIGIVKIKNEFEEIKFYIGTGEGFDKEEDEKSIAEYGARFPNECGEKLI